MKPFAAASLLSLTVLTGCVSWERPYISDDSACGELVDPRARLDCIAAAEQAEDDWREDKRREEDWKKDAL